MLFSPADPAENLQVIRVSSELDLRREYLLHGVEVQEEPVISFTMKTELDFDSSLIPRSLGHGTLDREIALAYRSPGQERSP